MFIRYRHRTGRWIISVHKTNRTWIRMYEQSDYWTEVDD